MPSASKTKGKAKAKAAAKTKSHTHTKTSSSRAKERPAARTSAGKSSSKAGSRSSSAKKPATKKPATPAKPAGKKEAPIARKTAASKPPAQAAAAGRTTGKGNQPGSKNVAATNVKESKNKKTSPAPAPGNKTAAGRKKTRRSARRSSLANRLGPNGEPFTPGDLVLPEGVRTVEEVQYLFRGCAAAERPATEAGVDEVLSRRLRADPDASPPEGLREELLDQAETLVERFVAGPIESMLPARPTNTRRVNFPGVVERAKGRRREIGAFLRGLDVGRTEASHMDAHGEASLQNLMEWAARLENLAEADEPEQADYAQFHRGMDQLEITTELLMIDVEQTLKRLHDRVRAR